MLEQVKRSLGVGGMIALLATPSVFARITYNTIDSTATVDADGRGITLTGPLSCSETQPLYLRVTVTQRSTGAVAQALARIACTEEVQQWEVHATARGDETFTEGTATAVALAGSTLDGMTDDAHQWLVEVTLAGE